MNLIIIPRQGQSVESCVITKWHKKPGDSVAPGDLLFSYETDKSAFDEESKVGGTLLAVFFGEGDDVPCLTNVCAVGEPGEDISGLMRECAPQETHARVETPDAAPLAAAAPDAVAPKTTGCNGGISPRARALADKHGADLSQAAPTGPHGRLIARDVQALVDEGKIVTPAARGIVPEGVTGTGLGGRASLRDASYAPTPASAVTAAPPAAQGMPWATPDYREEPLPNIRRMIAKAMHESLQSMAQLTHTATYDATQILALRKQFRDNGAAYGMQGVTLGDLIVFTVSRTLAQPEHAHLNAHFLGDRMRFFSGVHLGVAVDTKRGLMVPTLRDADKKSLLEISTETKALAAACQGASIDPDLLTGATFTVSNLGAYEVEHFTPVINPPQTGILGVNTLQQRVREADGRIEIYQAMSISLTYDHRALDGAPASRFLRDLKRNLEHIQMLLGGGMFHV